MDDLARLLDHHVIYRKREDEYVVRNYGMFEKKLRWLLQADAISKK